MDFNYLGYKNLLRLLVSNHYRIVKYTDSGKERCEAILRHDIDYDLKKSLDLARIESEQKVTSTYFVLLTTDFYNVFSKHNVKMIKEIAEMGHDIGLHFDEMNYPDIVGNSDAIINAILNEAHILEGALCIPIRSVSMHRPSKEILQANLQIPGMINSYSDKFFRNYKYLSDSRRRWREPVEDIIKSQQYDKLHILTHAFWYNDEEIALRDTLEMFIEKAKQDRLKTLCDNFTNLDEVLGG